MADGWTPSRQAAQSAAIRQWRPWERSTGPRTADGKRRVSRNVYRGGRRAEFRQLMRQVRALLCCERRIKCWCQQEGTVDAKGDFAGAARHVRIPRVMRSCRSCAAGSLFP